MGNAVIGHWNLGLQAGRLVELYPIKEKLVVFPFWPQGKETTVRFPASIDELMHLMSSV